MNIVADTCPHHPRGVPEGHLCDARYVLVGEAPGEREDETGLPFVGQAGFVQDQLWKDVGISRQQEVYITNVLDHRPTPFSNDIKLVGKEEIARASKELMDRLRRRFSTPPAVLIPTGNTALFALTGRNGIQKWRGSIIEAGMLGPGWWTVPIIHPAALLRTPALAKTCLADWHRAKAVAVDRLRPVLGREHIIHPSKQERDLFLELVSRDPTRPISVDIETRRSDGGIICVGFGYSEKLSCTYMWEHRKWINDICSLPNPKILVNGFFDCWHLHRAGIEVVNFVWDLPCMFHCLDPAAGPTAKGRDKEGERSRIKCYSLAYMTSRFDLEPYYKDEAKEESLGNRIGDTSFWWQQFLTYNGKDCTSPWQIWKELRRELTKQNRLEVYHDLYSSLFDPLMRLMYRGVAVDVPAMDAKRRELGERTVQLRREIELLAGRPLHTVHQGAAWYGCQGCQGKGGKQVRHKTSTCPKGHPTQPLKVQIQEGESLSQTKLKEYLYGKGGLGLPVRRKKGKTTTDEAALRNLRLRYPARCGEVVGKILEFRRAEKLGTFVAGRVVDRDGRIRSQYKMLVSTGRLSSASNPSGTGTNLQNTDAELMYLLVPDKGKVFLRFDLSQSEDRVVKALTGVPRLVEEARADPELFDTHTEFAAKLFSIINQRPIRPVKGKGPDKVSGEMRYLGKRGRHARNYGMSEQKMAEVIAKDAPKVGITRIVTVEECKVILDAIDAITPEIATHYQRPIRQIIRNSGRLVNSWGAEIDFSAEYRYALRADQREDIFRRGYAWMPQAEIGRLMNQWGLKPLQRWLDETRVDAAVNLQRHDELVMSVGVKDLWAVSRFVAEKLERPRIYTLGEGYPRTELVIPVEFVVGRDGGKKGTLEFKRLPKDQTVFEQLVEEWVDAIHQ